MKSILLALAMSIFSASVAAEAQLPEKVVLVACYRPARVISGVKEQAPKETFERSTQAITEKFLSVFVGGLKEKGVSVEMKECPIGSASSGDLFSSVEILIDFLVFPYAWGPEKVAVTGTIRIGAERFALFQKGEKLPWLHNEDVQGVAANVEDIVSKKVARPVPKVVAVIN